MRIVIDGDGCPVVKQTDRIARENKLECIILTDTSHEINDSYATSITVSKGADSVDFALVNLLNKGDIVITQDYGLAAMCLARGAVPVHQDGMIYDEYNIESLLNARYTAQKIRRSGGRLKGSSKRTKDKDVLFEKSLNDLINKILS